MTTIVMNTLTGAVTEYDWSFQSITPTHAGDASGLYLLGGNLDLTLPIAATVMSGKLQWGKSLKMLMDSVYFSMVGAGVGLLRVASRSATYSYEFAIRASGVSRAKPGHGIRENYLAFGFSNVDGADFEIDKIEVFTNQSSRRI